MSDSAASIVSNSTEEEEEEEDKNKKEIKMGRRRLPVRFRHQNFFI